MENGVEIIVRKKPQHAMLRGGLGPPENQRCEGGSQENDREKITEEFGGPVQGR